LTSELVTSTLEGRLLFAYSYNLLFVCVVYSSALHTEINPKRSTVVAFIWVTGHSLLYRTPAYNVYSCKLWIIRCYPLLSSISSFLC